MADAQRWRPRAMRSTIRSAAAGSNEEHQISLLERLLVGDDPAVESTVRPAIRVTRRGDRAGQLVCGDSGRGRATW